MKLKLFVLGLFGIFLSESLWSQENGSDVVSSPKNITESLLADTENKLRFGGYAQFDYNQQFDNSVRYNGKLDPHRFVLFVGYQFSKQLHLVSELEIEHGNELYLEQAFINYNLNPFFQLRGGVMLVPMGITNEYHEPVTFNGVERPSITQVIIPTTWREMGIGFHGRLDPLALRYQFYLFNGFNGYDTQARFNGKNGLRNGRQKAINSYISSPNISAKIDFYGIRNLNVGLSGYFGNSQSKLYDRMDKDLASASLRADSSIVKIAMLGLDARYRYQGLEMRGEIIYTSIANTSQYNTFNNSKGDLGSAMLGYYAEIGYNLLHASSKPSQRLTPFVRFENYDTHYRTDGFSPNKAYHIKEWFMGIGYQPTEGVVFKADFQTRKSAANNTEREKWINLGVGFAF